MYYKFDEPYYTALGDNDNADLNTCTQYSEYMFS